MKWSQMMLIGAKTWVERKEKTGKNDHNSGEERRKQMNWIAMERG